MANFNLNEKESASQCAQIASWLNDGHSITQMQALTMFNCFRLASRINDLKSRGMDIAKRTIIVPSGKRVCEYFLNK